MKKSSLVRDFCWQCGKKLQMPYFAIVLDHGGHPLRVHKCCQPEAEEFFRPRRIVQAKETR